MDWFLYDIGLHRERFKDNEQANDLNEPKLKKRSTWILKENNYSIETFIELVNKDVESLITGKPKKTKSNLDKGKKDTLKELSEQTDVLITNVDNDRAVVIWETKDYINEANKQLNVISKTSLMIQQ